MHWIIGLQASNFELICWNTATSNYVLVFVCSPGSYQISAATFRLSAWTLRTLAAFPRLTLPWQGWDRIGCSASANCIMDAFVAFTATFSRVFPVSATLPLLKAGMDQCQDHNMHPKHLFVWGYLKFQGCMWRYCRKHWKGHIGYLNFTFACSFTKTSDQIPPESSSLLSSSAWGGSAEQKASPYRGCAPTGHRDFPSLRHLLTKTAEPWPGTFDASFFLSDLLSV